MNLYPLIAVREGLAAGGGGMAGARGHSHLGCFDQNGQELVLGSHLGCFEGLATSRLPLSSPRPTARGHGQT